MSGQIEEILPCGLQLRGDVYVAIFHDFLVMSKYQKRLFHRIAGDRPSQYQQSRGQAPALRIQGRTWEHRARACASPC